MNNPGERATPTPPVASFEAESSAKTKKARGPGDQRKSLIRFDPARKIQGFPSLGVKEVAAWLDAAAKADVSEDAAFGRDKSGEEMPAFRRRQEAAHREDPRHQG
jgi:hypothetical protein